MDETTRPEPLPSGPTSFRLRQFFERYRRLFILAALVICLSIVWSALSTQAREALWAGLLIQRTLLGLLLGFSLVMLSLLWGAGQRLDAWLFLYFNRHRRGGPLLDRMMWVSTQIGNGVFAIGAAILLFMGGLRRLAVEMLLGILTLWLMVELVKALTDRTRPYLALVGAKVIGWKERGRSFPSGHTSQTFFLVTLLIHYFKLDPLWSLPLYLIGVLVGFTRVYVGAHYPRDVLAGAILGSVWGILMALLDPFLVRRLF